MDKSPAALFFCLGIAALFSSGNPAKPAAGMVQQNHAPMVKIINPENNSSFSCDSRVHFSLSVEDQEDGDSRYEEINPKEVILEVRHIRNGEALKAALNRPMSKDPPGLDAMRISNCFNCHGFDNKLAGPSFREIAVKYESSQGNVDLLEKSIREGSAGAWGKAPMPSHPELTRQAIQSMVKWIMQLAKHPDVNYYVGTEGAFSFPPGGYGKRKGIYLLTASYTDHGIHHASRLKGQDVVIVRTW